MGGALPLLYLYGSMAWTRTTLALLSEIVTHTFSQSSDPTLLQLWQNANALFYIYIYIYIYNLI